MSTFKTLVKSERTKLEKSRAKLVQDRDAIDTRIEAIDVELQAMDAYAATVASAPAAPARKTTAAKPAAKAAAKPAAKAPAKAAAKPAAAKPVAAKPAAKPVGRPAKAAAVKTEKPSTKVAAKSVAPSAAAASGGVGRRDVILKMIGDSEAGMSRADLIQAMGVKGDKKQEKSISNALADLKKQNAVDLSNGVYVVAGKKPATRTMAAKSAKEGQLKNGVLKTGQVLQMPKTASKGPRASA